MPEQPEKIKPHPWKRRQSLNGVVAPPSRPSSQRYVELAVTSNFTFLIGASHPDELVHQAAILGHPIAAISDVNSLAGVVRAHVAAKEIGIPLAVGCRLRLGLNGTHPGQGRGSMDVTVYPTTREAYGRLCRLLTIGKRRSPKGECHLTLDDLIEHNEGLLAIVVPTLELDDRFTDALTTLNHHFSGGDRLSLAVSRFHGADDDARIQRIAAIAEGMNIPLLATNDVHYHIPQRKPVQDIITCIRHGCTIDEAGYRLFPNAERHLKSAQQMAHLFPDLPGAIARTVAIARRASQGFSLDELKYQYPDEVVPPGRTPMEHLIDLTWQGAAERFPQAQPAKVRDRIEHELHLIDELNYAPYFLTVHDLVRFARSKGILCQGRGAAANSAVCYCLGVTSVDPERINLLFERFISRERNEPPDIDIDFEHERREEVIQYVYNKYGRDRAALTAEVVTYRGRSAVREVGKALGLSLDCVDRLAKTVDWWDNGVVQDEQIRVLGINPRDPTIERLVHLAGELLGFPRHLSQHVGGFVMTRGPLCEMVPVENAAMEDRTVLEWDKDDIDAVGMLKVDVLGLGMLTVIQKAFGFVNERAKPQAAFALHTIPSEDSAVYDMICAADTIGVFQIESRAQMSMLPRLRPRCFYDLVIEVAIVRPGPIQGDMVHPYLRRRNGEEAIHYPDERVKKVLERTLGVPLFQEQAMSLAIEAAGFTPGEADQLRRAIAAWKQRGNKIKEFEKRIIDGMTANGYERSFAEQCFTQITGFSGYGFPESHAASFALLVYVSAWLKCHHPTEFAAALINSQPMGFYAPAQIVRDARDHGVEVRPVDVNHSEWDCTLEDGHSPGLGRGDRTNLRRFALRLGMRLVKGLQQEDAERVREAVQRHGMFQSIPALWRASGVRSATLRKIAAADGFRLMGLDRQSALWQVRALRDESLPMFDPPRRATEGHGHPFNLPPVSELRKVAHDYNTVGLTLRAHPISFVRDRLDAMNVRTAVEIRDEKRLPHGKPTSVAGLVLVRQRPATASGIVFMTIEDETGAANLIVRPKIYQRFRRAARHARAIVAHGHIERQGEVAHLVVNRMEELDLGPGEVAVRSRDFH